MEEKDAVIVGARCAGSTLAIALAERGWDVLLVDRDTFPSDTVSTHTFFPNTLARFEQLGILDTLRASHRLAWLEWRVAGMGIVGAFTPVDGFDRALSVRRIALDKAILNTALAAGAEGRLGEKVVDLIGSGASTDPISGVPSRTGTRCERNGCSGRTGAVRPLRPARDREGAPAARRVRLPVRLLERDPERRLRHPPCRAGRWDEPLGHRGRTSPTGRRGRRRLHPRDPRSAQAALLRDAP